MRTLILFFSLVMFCMVTPGFGQLTLDNDDNAFLFTGSGDADLNRYLLLLNSEDFQSGSGLKASGILVSDSYNFGDPGPNDLIVKGKVGIGTSTPTGKVEIRGSRTLVGANNDVVGVLQLTDPSTDINRDPTITAHSNANGGTETWFLGSTSYFNQNVGFFNSLNAPLILGTNDTERLRITGAGKVGIGTSTPSVKLHVTDAIRVGGPSVYAQLSHNGGSSGLVLNADANGGTWADMHFQTNGITRMYLRSNGNLGIGTVNPSNGLLEIQGSSGTGFGQLSLIETANEDFSRILFKTASDPVNHWEIAANNIDNYYHDGSSYSIFNIYHTQRGNIISCSTGSGGTNIVDIDAYFRVLNGIWGAAKPGGGEWSTLSDKRLKTDISEYEDGLKEILQLNPVRYQYNGKANTTTGIEYIGVIAQEIQKIAPYTVQEMEHGAEKGYLSYNGTALTYMLVNAIQEQQAIIEAKEKRIAKLEEENQAIHQELAELKELVQQAIGSKNSALQQTSTTLDQPAILKQNQPNPFTEATVIQYDLPKSIASAQLQITDQQGKTIKVIPINGVGAGQVELKSGTLAAGTYFYSLIADRKVVETKQMILTK